MGGGFTGLALVDHGRAPRLARLAQDREQYRRRLALASGQKAAPQWSQITTVPRRPCPGLRRLAARPAGDIGFRWLISMPFATSLSRASMSVVLVG